MLRNIIYRDKDIEIILVAGTSPRTSELTVLVYSGAATGTRSVKALLRCEFSHESLSLLSYSALKLCWVMVREHGSVASEIIPSVNNGIMNELLRRKGKVREIDWTKQIPTELGSGGTN